MVGAFPCGRVSGERVDVGSDALRGQILPPYSILPAAGVDSGVWKYNPRFAYATRLPAGASPPYPDDYDGSLRYTYKPWGNRAIRQMSRWPLSRSALTSPVYISPYYCVWWFLISERVPFSPLSCLHVSIFQFSAPAGIATLPWGRMRVYLSILL